MRHSLLALLLAASLHAIDLSHAVILTPPGPELPAATVLAEELQHRSGLRLKTTTIRPAAGAVIALAVTPNLPPDGYQIATNNNTVQINGASPRAVLYGVGHLLRQLNWGPNTLELPNNINLTSAPKLPIRGHQLGYRNTNNTWDAWTVPQFETYIRELALFGMNAVEGIPLFSEKPSPHAKLPAREMNRAITQICERYGLDYWIWAPVQFKPADTAKASAYLDEITQIARDSATLSALFVPGGDPGDNPPETLLPFLAQMAARVRAVHPQAQIWLSLQGFNEAKANYVYAWLARETPPWFGGIVAGPSSPPVAETRRRIPAGMKIRLYPDVSHNVRSQFEVPDWDQTYALTLGRETVNPRPVEYAARHRKTASLASGGITYSDGVHDDVNKIIWTALDWDPNRAPRDILIEYARLYLNARDAEEIADAILALENNWRGPLLANGAVEGTLRWWQSLATRHPELSKNWRWQMNLLRAVYDAYLRRRLLEDTQAEADANAALRRGEVTPARQALARPTKETALRQQILDPCDQLWLSINLQSSVEKYKSRDAQRGAIRDFVDLPLNNRWWLEDEIAKAEKLPETQRNLRLLELANWESPGEGSFYDDIGNIAKMPHVERDTDEDEATPLFWWRNDGYSRERRSWLVTQWPHKMVYEGLDPKFEYTVRTTGYGQALLKINGKRVQPVKDGKQIGEFKEFTVPPSELTNGRIVLTWDKAGDEAHLNWRNRSRLSEVWLLRGTLRQ